MKEVKISATVNENKFYINKMKKNDINAKKRIPFSIQAVIIS